jgi:hypothetical protein
MIEPTEKDIGRAVIYHRWDKFNELGVITNFNDAYVFVRYGAESHGKATKREDLHWTDKARIVIDG